MQQCIRVATVSAPLILARPAGLADAALAKSPVGDRRVSAFLRRVEPLPVAGSNLSSPQRAIPVTAHLILARPAGLADAALAKSPVGDRRVSAFLRRVEPLPVAGSNLSSPQRAIPVTAHLILARPAGFEPATCGLEIRCSIQLG